VPRLLESTRLAALLAAATLACGTASPKHPPAAVAVVGSSTAAGTGASTGSGWVERVRAAAATDCPQVTITNLAVPGDTTWDGLPVGARLTPVDRPAPRADKNLDAALALRPALVFVQYPSNDAVRLYPLQETLDNHAIYRDWIRAAGALDVILGPFPRENLQYDAQVALMTGLRDQLPAVAAPRYVELWADLAATDRLVIPAYAAGDGIHLNDTGHAVIAAKVLASAAWASVCQR
jgi:lysophospholipase L1-like esterase